MKNNKKTILYIILFMLLMTVEPIYAADNWCTELESVFTLFGYVVNIAYVFTPIILIVTGAITLIKALMNNESAIKKAQDVMIKKTISAVCVFVVMTLVRVVIKTVADDAWENCANCFINPRSCNLSVSLGNQDETLEGGANALPTNGSSSKSNGTN